MYVCVRQYVGSVRDAETEGSHIIAKNFFGGMRTRRGSFELIKLDAIISVRERLDQPRYHCVPDLAQGPYNIASHHRVETLDPFFLLSFAFYWMSERT